MARQNKRNGKNQALKKSGTQATTSESPVGDNVNSDPVSRSVHAPNSNTPCPQGLQRQDNSQNPTQRRHGAFSTPSTLTRNTPQTSASSGSSSRIFTPQEVPRTAARGPTRNENTPRTSASSGSSSRIFTPPEVPQTAARGPTRNENTPRTSASSGSSSRIFTPPEVPQTAARGPKRQNVLAPLRLDLLEEAGPSRARPETNELAEQLNKFIKNQERFNEELMLSFQEKEQENEDLRARSKRKRLPKLLTAHVREVYKHLTANEEDGTVHPSWDLTKCFNDKENSTLNRSIFEGLRSTDSETTTVTIKAAMRVHFRTKRREFLLKSEKKDKCVLKAQRRRSRLNSKKTLRLNALRGSTSIPEVDKTRIAGILTMDYMSSEHSPSEESENGGSGTDDSASGTEVKGPKEFTSHKLPWRSAEADRALQSLDRRVLKRRGSKGRSMMYKRKTGSNSTRSIPDDAPAWAVRNIAPRAL